MNLDGNTNTVEHDGFSITSTDSEDAIKTTLGVDAQAEKVIAEPKDDDLVIDDDPKADVTAADETPIQKADEQPRDAEGKFTRKDWQKRVDKLTHNWRSVETERDALRAELDALKAPKADPPPAASDPTTFPAWEAWVAKNDGKGYEDYLDERADWRAERKAQAILDARDQQAREAEVSRRTMSTIDKLKSLGEKAHDDFEDVMVAMAEGKRTFAPHIAGIIAEELDGASPLGHELAYFLATHPDDLRRLNALPPLTAARQVQKILDTFTAPVTRGSGAERPAVSQAKPPTKPIGAGHAADPNQEPDDNEPFETYFKRENERDRKAGRLR